MPKNLKGWTAKKLAEARKCLRRWARKFDWDGLDGFVREMTLLVEQQRNRLLKRAKTTTEVDEVIAWWMGVCIEARVSLWVTLHTKEQAYMETQAYNRSTFEWQ